MKLFSAIFFTTVLMADVPPGYYDGVEGLDGESLRLALHNIIDDHTSQSYSSLYGHFESTDAKSDGTVWDMYSDVPDGTPPYIYNFTSEDQCGNYSGEGDCFNREHSWPKSWFNEGMPMNTDLFHIYPTDGYVNGMRSNYAYGEVANATWTSQNGSRRGSMNSYNHTGTVFEPIDAYKGDFARTYFYMSTRYCTEDSGWDENDMVDGADLKEWAVHMLLDWHESDPVSQKETDRNDAVYDIQGNRNPLIDFPAWVECIWGECNLTVGSDLLPTRPLSIENFPNPFNPSTTISISVETHMGENDASLCIYDVKGQLLATLINGTIKPGKNEVRWDAVNFSSGVYFAVLQSGNDSISKKLIYLK